jgi:hypothetical protein
MSDRAAMDEALRRLFEDGDQYNALMGKKRHPIYPSLHETLGDQSQQYQLMPNGLVGPEAEGQMPVYNPNALYGGQLPIEQRPQFKPRWR